MPVFAAGLLLAAAQSAPSDVASTLARVRSDVAAKVPSDQQAPAAARLDRAEAALEAGRSYLALYLLESPFETASASAFARSAGAATPRDFLDRWTAVGAPVRQPAQAGARPAIVDALASAAEGRAPATYQASRPYAEDAGVDAGLHYLGESRAQMEFAAHARTLRWPASPPRPAFRSIAGDIAALDAEMTAKYETMTPAEHSTYIAASAALKQARSLDDAREYGGALFEYLLSRYLFAPLRGPAAQDATAVRIADARAALGSRADHSIAEMFLQLADEGVSGTVAAQRRGAAAALEDVLPAYLAAVVPSSVSTGRPSTAQVTITLVRWPFT
jgi:hypothetical protein